MKKMANVLRGSIIIIGTLLTVSIIYLMIHLNNYRSATIPSVYDNNTYYNEIYNISLTKDENNTFLGNMNYNGKETNIKVCYHHRIDYLALCEDVHSSDDFDISKFEFDNDGSYFKITFNNSCCGNVFDTNLPENQDIVLNFVKK